MSWSAALEGVALTGEERQRLRKLLRLAVSSFRPARQPERASVEGMADIADAMRRQAPHAAAVSATGYLWKGRPPWADAACVDALVQEAGQVRPRAVRATNHLMVESAPGAREILERRGLADFVHEHARAAAPFVPTSTYYHWYETEQDFAEPHLDTEDFAVSVLMLLRHARPPDGEARSAFFVCPPGGGPAEVALAVGEAVLMYSGSVVHARSAPAPGEAVTTVSWGLKAGS